MAKKPTVTTLASGFNSTETLNANFEALRDGFDNTLSLDGSTPNAMGGDLDLNSNNIINATAIMVGGSDVVATTAAALAAAVQAQIDADAAVVASALSETNAANSATAAFESANTASSGAILALQSRIAANSSENSAASSASTATTKAGEASTSAAAAAASEAGVDADRVAAQTAATNAATSETNAATSETNAATSATNAATSETNAATSATSSATSATASATSETNASTSETNAATSETNASTSETNASTSEANAATSETNAATSASTATTKATEASTSATNAATSATSAQASKDAALAALDSFDDRYLGQKTADPTVDNDGDALVSGALYFNTTDDIMKVYDGSLWVAAYASLSGAMFGANNLSDVADAAGSRQNLGLGTGNSPTFAGLTTTANVSFGDNDKATFGADSDLQIYHDGSNSYVTDTGTGDLIIDSNGNAIRLKGTNGENMIVADTDASAKLFYNGLEKLATTSTGVDVTGTITSDGLTVDGTSTFTSNIFISHNASPLIRLEDTDTALDFDLLTSGSSATIRTKNGAYPLFVQTNEEDRIKVAGNGDISFYEDTGTTPKFFWDASAESLGIGTTSPQRAITVSGSQPFIQMDNTATGGEKWELFSGTNALHGVPDGTFVIRNHEGAGNVLHIDSSGNVGIGTSSPDTAIHAATGAGATLTLENTNTDLTHNELLGGIDFKGNDNSEDGNEVLAYIRANAKDTTPDAYLTFGTLGNAGGVDDVVTERMRIDNSGNLLVGTTTPEIRGQSSIEGFAYRTGNSLDVATTSGLTANFNRMSTDGDIVQFRKDGSTVGSLGTASGTTYITGAASGLVFNYGRVGSCNTSGAIVDNTTDLGNTNNRFKDAYFSGTVNAGNFNTTSDATLKTNVETLTGSLDKVKALRGVSYDWIESGGSEIGVIAQEVEAVIPDVVSTNDEGIKSVKYGNMVAVLIEAIKEQQLRIEALESKLGE